MAHHVSSSQRSTPNSLSQIIMPAERKSPLPIATDTCEASAARPAPARARRTRNLALALAIVAGLAGAFLLTLGYPVSSAQDAPNAWVAAAMLTPRNSHSLTELTDGRLLAAGGWDGSAPLASAELFDPERRAWTPTGALSETRAYHTAARLPDDRVLVAGGWDLLGRPLTSTEIYNPAAGAWQPGAALAEGRAGHVAVTLADGRILVAAGCGPNAAALATAEVYDAAAAAWQAAGALAEGRCWPTATVLADGRVLLAGGRGRDGQALGSAELYDPVKNTWTPAGKLLTPRLEHTATWLPDGRVLVTGGYDGSGYLASAELYDPATNAWTAAGELTTARANHAAVLLRDGRVLVAGGAAGGRPSLETEIYDSQAGRWTLAGALPARYEAFLLTALRDGSLLVTGRPELDEAPVRLATPEPARTPGPRGPTPTPAGAVALDAAARDLTTHNVAGAAMAMAQAAASTSNYSTGTQTARLFGVHEISFTLPSVANPYASTVLHTVTFTPQLAPSEAKTVRAFYNGSMAGRDIWAARVYVHRVGAWQWQPPAGAYNPFTGQGFTDAEKTFQAEEASDSGLHGMLRVSALATPSSTAPGSAKRWYTDDGRTFLPMADTAYYLFFEKPTTTPDHPLPAACPTRLAADVLPYIDDYVQAVTAHGINTLRVNALGSFGWSGAASSVNPATPEPCMTDLSLYWAPTFAITTSDLFDAAPAIVGGLGTAGLQYYPNFASFRATDQKLQFLLNEHPGIYIQMILLYDDGVTAWRNIHQSYREQMWETMIARWAAFPNVFWTVENDIDDTSLAALDTGEELSCYFSASPVTDGTSANVTVVDPWRANRPFGFGHERGAIDTMRNQSWLSYITAYAAADLSAQQMDGNKQLPGTTNTDTGLRWSAKNHYYVGSTATPITKPVFYVEDFYEGNGLAAPDYFYRRLFWSYLLSGSGVTYGADSTSQGWTVYSTPMPTQAPLVGLNHIGNIADTLAAARVDLNLFRPADKLGTVVPPVAPSPTWTANTAEFDRAQVAVRDGQEMLIYVPNSQIVSTSTPGPNQYWPMTNRRAAREGSGHPQFKANLTGFPQNYAYTWYSVDQRNASGVIFTTQTGAMPAPQGTPTPVVLFQAPPGIEYDGDVLLHISARCTAPNVCEPMETPIPTHEASAANPVYTSPSGFKAGDDESALLKPDAVERMFGARSWRCDRPTAPGSGFPGCWVRYDFPSGQSIASADFYYRRNSGSTFQAIYFITTPGTASSEPIEDADDSVISFSVWFGPGGDLHLESSPPNTGLPVVMQNVAPDINRWYHMNAKVERTKHNLYQIRVYVDGALQIHVPEFGFFGSGDHFFRRTVVHTAWWGATNDLPEGDRVSAWWDELSIDPVQGSLQQGLYSTNFQQGLGGYTGTRATYFDGAAGYDGSAFLRVGANNYDKGLLRFNVSNLPADAIIDEATLALYYTGRSNANGLTLGMHGVLADWTASAANRIQRQTGLNWQVAGMGAGSDYAALPAATLAVTGEGNAWIELDITDLAQTWVADPSQNHGLVLLQETATGSVVYSFCSEVAQAPATPTPPCLAGHAPKLTLRYHLTEPAPLKATFQRGANGYTGNVATYFDGSGNGYNASTYLRVSADGSQKSLLRFDVSSIPVTDTIDMAMLRMYQASPSNANGLTLAAHEVLADWTDSQANRMQRQTGVNWQVVGMGAGSDYATAADGTAELTSVNNGWVDVDVTDMVQAWVADASANHGLVLKAQAATGSVTYSFCSELGWSPCTMAQAPVLKVWHHQPPPTPEPTPEPEP